MMGMTPRATPTFRLGLYEPLPSGQRVDVLDINPRVTAMRWSTQIPGGFTALEVGIEDDSLRKEYGLSLGYLPLQTEVIPFGHVVLRAGSATLFEGRIVKIIRVAGQPRGFLAHGYGVSAVNDNYFSSESLTEQTTGTFLEDVLEDAAPLLSIAGGGLFVDPQILVVPSDYDQMTPGEIIDQIAKQGGTSANVVWDWSVYDRRRARFLPRLAPNTPDYHIPFDESVRWEDDYTDAYGGVLVTYGDSGTSSVTGSNANFLDRYGLQRTAVVRSNIASNAGAVAFRDTYLAQHLTPKSNVSIARRDGQGLTRPGGAETPPWLVRAGQWVGVGSEPLLPIVNTTFDAFALRLSLQVGAIETRTLDGFLATQHETVTKVARKINPITGGVG